jgi:predicted kinase
MPRLILFNGPPGVGKSTLAQRYSEEHRLALNLDVDRVRGLIGGWHDDPHTAGLLARSLTLAAARTHLAGGYDVVIPQFLGRTAFIDDLELLAHEAGADFHEIVLLDSKESTLRRFAERSRTSTDPAHLEARELLDRAGGLQELSAMYDRLLAVIALRPRAKIVSTSSGTIDKTYRDVMNNIS